MSNMVPCERFGVDAELLSDAGVLQSLNPSDVVKKMIECS